MGDVGFLLLNNLIGDLGFLGEFGIVVLISFCFRREKNKFLLKFVNFKLIFNIVLIIKKII